MHGHAQGESNGTQRASNDRLRIILFCKSLVNVGGAERLLLKEWEYLSAAGHDVSVVTYDVDERALYGMRQRLGQSLVQCRGRSWTSRLFRFLNYVRSSRCDLVIVSGGMVDMGLVRFFHAVRIIYHHHQPLSMTFNDFLKYAYRHRDKFDYICGRNPDAATVFPLQRRSRPWTRRLFDEVRTFLFQYAADRADAILVFSDYAREETERYFRSPVVVNAAAFDTGFVETQRAIDPFPKPPGETIFLVVARLDRNKRVDTAIDAFAIASESLPQARLYIAGTGPERDRLADKIHAHGIEERCTLLNFVPQEALDRWYRTADCFVSLDWADFRLTALEALAAGTPIIITDEVPADPALLDTGYVQTSPPHPQPLANKMIALADGDQDRDLSALDAALRGYTWDAYFNRMMALF